MPAGASKIADVTLLSDEHPVDHPADLMAFNFTQLLTGPSPSEKLSSIYQSQAAPWH